MNKSELIDAIAEDTKLTKKDIDVFIKAFVENVSKSLEKGEDVQLIGFGTFTVAQRAERKGHNPQNPKQEITIPASKLPRFKAGKALKERVNK
ncbi:MAG: HU family DNA-binding protein [Treponema sp.]|nr:HU family DNA-binding protein [Treponema sp.]